MKDLSGLYLEPIDCSVLARYLKPVVRRAGMVDPEFMAIVHRLEAHARAWRASTGSADGNSEVPTCDESDDLWDLGYTGVTTREAGERLGVSPRQVINLITKTESLSGSKVGGSWMVTIESLEREKERRDTERRDRRGRDGVGLRAA